jgi:hypothetical protein
MMQTDFTQNLLQCVECQNVTGVKTNVPQGEWRGGGEEDKMPTVVYRCSHGCKKHHEDIEIIKIHELKCNHNPDNKSCPSCKHYSSGYERNIDGHGGYNYKTCEQDADWHKHIHFQSDFSHKKDFALPANCDNWEPKEQPE